MDNYLFSFENSVAECCLSGKFFVVILKRHPHDTGTFRQIVMNREGVTQWS